jgi:hypothetical protein
MNPNRINTPLVTIVGILIVLALVFFGFLMFRAADDTDVAIDDPVDTEPVDEPRVADRLVAAHEYADGTHTVAGEIQLPTPCHAVEVEPVFINDDERNVELQFTTSVDEDVMCAQVITPQAFRVSFEAPEDAAISTRIDGQPVVLNLVEVPEGQTIDAFDEFIKW